MRIAAACVVLFFASLASAQVIYSPIQYQYGNKYPFYYGGHDPRVIDFAGSCNNNTTDLQVYTDCIPFQNARLYGYTAADAHNEAYQSIPRYFRKGDLLRAAIPVGDGSYVVPAETVGIPAADRVEPAHHSVSPIIIIPKRLLKQPLNAQPQQVASAR